ncbi:MAG: selenide, water dikinase SelD [Bacteroidales bacterium]|nr:selenide, water dikinase SelD [Bacteroidales bacterium]
MKIDLLNSVDFGGCSAKLSPKLLEELLSDFPTLKNENLLVDVSTHDDAAAYKINDETVLIFTTDFFPPLCSDPYTFGQIAATNALSDVYAMGGKPLMALNLTMFPTAKMPVEVLKNIVKGGYDKVTEAGAMIVGGHTIEDYPPKYGLAVVGTVHPDNLVTNANAVPNDVLILTKPLGVGVVMAAKKVDMADDKIYDLALNQMSTLNAFAASMMRKYHVKCATDVTGFGLLGHAYELAKASDVTLHINTKSLPVLPNVIQLLESGCIPGAAFRNKNYVESVSSTATFSELMLCCDAQTSGGLLMCVPSEKAQQLLAELQACPDTRNSSIIGKVSEKNNVFVSLS